MRYDWRARFGMSLDESVPGEIGWDEARDLIRILRTDPSSQFFAAMESWDQPHSSTDLILMRQYELTQSAAGVKKPQPYPTAPWAKAAEVDTKRRGNAAGRTPDEVKELLRTRFGQAPV